MKILFGSLFVVLLILCWTNPSSEQSPEINGSPIVANLHEETAVETEIVCINCTSPDGNLIEVSDITITPFARFFDIYKLAGNEDYCVYFLPSQGSPDYARVRAYNIEIQCDDTINPPTKDIVEIRIRTNEPPQITSPLSDTCTYDAKATKAGTQLNTLPIIVNDTDNDVITPILTTIPASAAVNYEVVRPDSLYEEYYIVAKNDLTVECNSDVTFYVRMSDSKNNPVGPVTISCVVTNHYTTPKISNVDKNIYVSEDTVLDTSLITFETQPPSPLQNYLIDTNPATEVGLFDATTTGADKLKLVGQLNYENPLHRNITVSIQPDNGFCPPETQYLNIITTDANDPPILGPKDVTKTVYEGFITVNPEFTLTDEDTDDSWTYSIVDGNQDGYFTIDPYTGVVSSTVEYDTDLSRMKGNQSLLIQVQDKKGNAIDNATLHLVIQDANDNPPEFTAASQQSATFTVTECTAPGGTLGRELIAADKFDTAFQDNNSTYIVPTENQYMRITSSGDIIQSGQIPAGTVSTLTVYAQDRGQYPNIQTSLNPVTITLVGTACPTTQTVTVVNNNNNGGTNTNTNTNTNTVATVAPTTTTTAAVVATCTGFFCDAGNIALTVLASLLGLALLGLLGTLLYRYCCNKPAVEVKRTWTPPRKVRPVTPPTPPPRVRTPVTPRQITPRIEYVPTPVAVPVAPPPPALMRVRRLVPVKQQQMVKVKQMVAVPQNVTVKRLVPVPGNAAAAVAPK